MSKRWYIVHAYSNFERKVAEDIKKRALAAGLADFFDEVLVPTEEVVEVRRGRKVSSERKFFPGYVLVKMEMTDGAYHLIKNTPKVTGFLGSRHQADAGHRRRSGHASSGARSKEGVERPKPTVTFEIGENRAAWPTAPSPPSSGSVEQVDEQRARLQASPSPSSAAPTPVELEYGQVEKVA